MTDDDVLGRLLQDRHSCRGFLAEPLPRALISRLLLLAQRTASWCNVQPWHSYVMSGDAVDRFRSAMVEAATHKAPTFDVPPPPGYYGIHLERRRAAGLGLYSALGISRGDKEEAKRQGLENFRFFGAPHVAIVTCDAALGSYGLVDIGGYLATVSLAAQALGIGLIVQAALAMHSDTVRTHLSVPDDRVIIAGMSMGYEDGAHAANHFRTARSELHDAVTWLD